MPTVIHNVPHAAPWGLPVVQYAYFAGASVGTFVVSALWTVLAVGRCRPLAKPAAVVSLVLIAAASLCLLADLEQPLRFWRLYTSFEARSSISWGAWLLAGYIGICAANAWLLCRGTERPARLVGVAGLVLGPSLVGAIGLGLTAARARPFWNNPLFSFFLIAAIISGSATMIVYAAIRKRIGRDGSLIEQVLPELAPRLKYAVALGLVLSAYHPTMLALRGGDCRLAAFLAVRDPLFVTGVLAGYLLPVAILWWPRAGRSTRWATIASLLALVGVWCAHYAIFAIGQAIPLS